MGSGARGKCYKNGPESESGQEPVHLFNTKIQQQGRNQFDTISTDIRWEQKNFHLFTF